MKRVLSTIICALVALAFAGIVSAVDTPSSGSPNTSNADPTANMPKDMPADSTVAPATKTTKKKKKKKTTKKTRKRPAGTGMGTGTEPNYGTPATGGPSGTMGTEGSGSDDTGTGGAGR